MLRRKVLILCEAKPTPIFTPKRGLVCTQTSVAAVPGDELADLISDSSEKPSSPVASPWKSGDFPRDSVLFPSELLETVREEPMTLSSSDRLAYLWSTSNSHGVSWDELDDAFLSFHREYLQAEHSWSENYDQRWEAEHQRSEDILRETLSGTSNEIALSISRRRGKVRRMTYTRLARMRNKHIIQPFNLCRFTEYMKRYVEQRVAKREQSEKALD